MSDMKPDRSNYSMVPVIIMLVGEKIETYEPPHGKTNKLHMRKQRRRLASR